MSTKIENYVSYLKNKNRCPTWGAGVSVILGAANFAGDPSNKREHSVYADPIPTPAPKATDAQRETGLPGMTNQDTLIKIINLWMLKTLASNQQIAKEFISLCQG